MRKTKLFQRVCSLVIVISLLIQHSGFAQVVEQLNISGYLSGAKNNFTQDKFRPPRLRYLQYLPAENRFKLLLDKGSDKPREEKIKEDTKKLMEYFAVGISLSNESFWVNLRPDSPDNIIDSELARTDIGKIMLESDLQLKKDLAKMTSPETTQGRIYWDKLYKKAEELFGYENITIPTLTRPWIVPGEIIMRESHNSAYIYKAALKVMLEEDYLKSSQLSAVSNQQYEFKDPRAQELNKYSTQLIRELILPKLTKEINTSKRYAGLRQVYFSLILAQWFKQRQGITAKDDARLKINSGNLTGLTSQNAWSKETYFQAYQKSFKDGEYNVKEPVFTPTGQVIRSYFSGGEVITLNIPPIGAATSGGVSSSIVLMPSPTDNLPYDIHGLELVEVGPSGIVNLNLSQQSTAVSSGVNEGKSKSLASFKKPLAAILTGLIMFSVSPEIKTGNHNSLGYTYSATAAENSRKDTMPASVKYLQSKLDEAKKQCGEFSEEEFIGRQIEIICEAYTDIKTEYSKKDKKIEWLNIKVSNEELINWLMDMGFQVIDIVKNADGKITNGKIVLTEGKESRVTIPAAQIENIREIWLALTSLQNKEMNESLQKAKAERDRQIASIQESELSIAQKKSAIEDIQQKYDINRQKIYDEKEKREKVSLLELCRQLDGKKLLIVIPKPELQKGKLTEKKLPSGILPEDTIYDLQSALLRIQDPAQMLLIIGNAAMAIDNQYASETDYSMMHADKLITVLQEIGFEINNGLIILGETGNGLPVKRFDTFYASFIKNILPIIVESNNADQPEARIMFLQKVKEEIGKIIEEGGFLQNLPEASEPVSSSNSSSPLMNNPVGGIDFTFTAFPIINSAVNNLTVGGRSVTLGKLLAVNLDKDWRQIEKMISSDMIFSSQRIYEYLQASCAQGVVDMDRAKISSCISGRFMRDEEDCLPSDPLLIDILVVLESGSSLEQLNYIFTGTG